MVKNVVFKLILLVSFYFFNMALELLNYIRDLSPISMGCAELNSQNCSLLGLEGVVEANGSPMKQTGNLRPREQRDQCKGTQ